MAAAGAANAALRYDPLGRLYEVTGASGTTRFLYDGDALVAEYNTAGTLLRRYVHGNAAGADDPLVWFESNARRDLHADHQGTVIAVASFDEWGIPGAANQGRFQHTGQAWIAELGMDLSWGRPGAAWVGEGLVERRGGEQVGAPFVAAP